MTFDRPIVWTGAAPDDGSLPLGGQVPSAIYQLDPTTFQFSVDPPVYVGSPWALMAQPAWLTTPVAVPQSESL